MADISRISRLVSGIQRQVDLQANSLVVGSLKVGATSPEELTKTILTNLIALQNGSDFTTGTNSHTHDGRYFTESELGSASASSGSDLIGDDNTYSNFTPSAATVKGALAGIDAALATAGGTSFSDAAFEVYDNGDNTKKIVFQASGITTGTTRTITMANANVNLTDVNNAVLIDGTRAMTASLDLNGNQILNLGTPTLAAHAATKSYVDTYITGLDFQADINDYVADANTTSPGTGLPAAATGQRYVLASNTGSLHAGWGAITGVGDNDIVQYNGSAWVVAYDVSVQGEGALVWNKDDNYFMYYNGTAWAEFGGLAGVTAGNGIDKTGNTLFLNFNEMAAVAIASGDELAFGDISDSNIVKKITFSSFESTLNHDNLAGFVANEHVDHSTVSIATAADSGLSGGGDITTTRNLVVDITGTTAETSIASGDEILIYDVSASARKKATVENILKNQNIYEELVAGESFAADTTFFVRFAISGDTAGRFYKTSIDASSTNKFYAIGLIQPTASVTAGDTIKVLIKGTATLVANDTAFAAGEIGEPVHLLGTGGGFDAVSQITYTANQASFRVGYVKTTTTIFLDGSKQLNGIEG